MRMTFVPGAAGFVDLHFDSGEAGQGAAKGPPNRPLRILFMACSPRDVEPVLDFENEEKFPSAIH